jgi:predicted nucleotidyltransferase
MKFDFDNSKIAELCKKHSVLKAYVFGSALTEKFHDESDIDIVVRFESVDLRNYFKNYLSFKNSLENLFKRKVDLVEEQSIRNPILKRSIDDTKTLIYG